MKELKLILLILFLNYTFVFCQKIESSVLKDYIFDSVYNGECFKYLMTDIKELSSCPVEKNAEFQGGNSLKLKDWVIKNIDYTIFSIDSSFQGDFNCLFTVGSDGKIIDLIITKGLGYQIDKEICRVIRLSPDWIPAKNKGKWTDQVLGLKILITKNRNN